MKYVLFSLFCIIICSAADCYKKEGENCHKSFIFKNNSSDTVIFALRWTEGVLCQLNGENVPPTKESGLAQRECWEVVLDNGKIQDIYIIDPAKYNDPFVFYHCDSIEIKNKILKHYILTIDSLRKYNFIINYP